MNLTNLPTYDANDYLQAVVETPRGSSAKIAYDQDTGIFRFSRPLMLGVTYPYDCGFVPGTLAADGEPLDVIIFHDAVSFPGVVISCKAIGVVTLTQGAGDNPRDNERLIARRSVGRRDQVGTIWKRRPHDPDT